jgi:hypothetical protein
MRYFYALAGLFLMLAAVAVAESFKADLDVDTYVDAKNPDQSFGDSGMLWAASEGGKPVEEVYLSFINLFESQGTLKPEQIKSATLTLNVTDVKTPGEIRAYFVDGAVLSTSAWDYKPAYDSSVSASVNVEGNGSYTLDVTPLIKKAVETCVQGCPYSIALVAEDGTSVGFASRESGGTNNPQLVYTTQGGTSATAP